MTRRRHRIAPLVIAAMVATILVGVGGTAGANGIPLSDHGSRPRLFVSAHEAMADTGFRIRVGGLAPSQLVVLRLTIEAGVVTVAIPPFTTWSSAATFRADDQGRVDLSTQSPVAGSYSGIDPMGLFWSARPTTTPAVPGASTVTERAHLALEVGGREVAATDLVLDYLHPGATATPVTEDGLVGTLYAPAGGGRHPAMVVFGGSEGGKAFTDPQAALLASHGYAALSLAYFGVPGVPSQLSRIPLEYFGRALDWLARQPGVDPERIGVRGGSRGGELALLLGTRFPQVKAVVAAAPSSVVWSGIGPGAEVLGPAWTEHGQPVPFLIPDLSALPDGFQAYLRALHSPAAPAAAIPVEDINGPVLLLNGADDQLWPSEEMSEQVLARLRAHGHPYPDEHHSYPGNGHLITLPGLPTTAGTAGGNPADSARAARAAWSTTLRFLDDNLACAFRPRTGPRFEALADSFRHRVCVWDRHLAETRRSVTGFGFGNLWR